MLLYLDLYYFTENNANEYERIVYANYEKIKQNIFQNRKLAEIRNWLLPMLMNRQVTVKDK